MFDFGHHFMPYFPPQQNFPPQKLGSLPIILSFQSKAVTLKNKDYEKEKRSEQEAFEKKIGLLTYLGQSVPKTKGW